MAISREERIKKIDEKMEQLKKQKYAIRQRQIKIERQQRAGRLIPKGALLEKYLVCEFMSPQEIDEMLKKIVQLPEVQEIINNNPTERIFKA